MNRLVPGPWGEAIGEALAILPEPVMERLAHVDFLCGTDPVYAGLWTQAPDSAELPDGLSYLEVASCAYPWHNADRSTTIVLPQPWVSSFVVVHELGHALHALLDFKPQALPVNDYAGRNWQEAFAEAFAARYFWWGDQDVAASDQETLALFAELGA